MGLLATPVSPATCNYETYDPIEYKTEIHEVLERTPSNLGRNCVAFAKSKRPDLPQGLYTLQAKKNIIKTKEPYEGAVAVLAESPAGHLAIVLEIRGENVLLEESNWHAGYISKRIVSKHKPLGYF